MSVDLSLTQLPQVESMANVTEIHDPLHFDATATGGPGEDVRYARSFGIWSISWSPGGREIIAGEMPSNTLPPTHM